MKIKRYATKAHFKDLIAFFLVAVAGSSVNFISRMLYGKFLPFNISIIPAYLTGMIIGFVLTKRFAFNAKASGNTRREMVKFLIISLIALAVTYIVAVSMLYILSFYLPHFSLFMRETLAHVTGMGFSFITNFVGHKLFTFRPTGFYDRVRVRQRQRQNH